MTDKPRFPWLYYTAILALPIVTVTSIGLYELLFKDLTLLMITAILSIITTIVLIVNSSINRTVYISNSLLNVFMWMIITGVYVKLFIEKCMTS